MAENVKITISAIDKTKKAFGGVTSGLRAVSKAAFSMKGALIAAAGPAAIGFLIKQSLTATDSLKKTADKIGTSTEALSKFQFAAQLTGVSVETVNMAAQRFTRRLAEAAKGTGEAKSALRELNINAEELKKKSLDDQMLALADAFGNVQTSADKVRLAMKLFDSEGVSLVNTLAEGRDGLKAMFAEAETLGVVMSGRAAQGVEDANDALTKLFALFKGIRDQITAALAPVIEYLADLMKNKLLLAIEAASGSVEKFANETIKQIVIGFGNMIVGIGHGVSAFIEFANAVRNTYHQVKQFFDEGHIFVENTFGQESADKIKAAGRAIISFGESSAFAFGQIKQNNDELEKTPTIFNKWGDAIKDVSESMPSLREHMVTVGKTIESSFTDGLTKAITGAKSFGDAMKDMARTVIDSLVKMMVQYHIVQPILGALGGALGIPTATPSGKAIGGSVQSGQPYMVGERGPELFVPNSQGSIVPNGNVSGGSGVVVNQTINVTTGVQQTVRAEIATLMPQIANAAKGAVADARMRGGGYSKALVGA